MPHGNKTGADRLGHLREHLISHLPCSRFYAVAVFHGGRRDVSARTDERRFERLALMLKPRLIFVGLFPAETVIDVADKQFPISATTFLDGLQGAEECHAVGAAAYGDHDVDGAPLSGRPDRFDVGFDAGRVCGLIHRQGATGRSADVKRYPGSPFWRPAATTSGRRRQIGGCAGR